MTRSLPSLVGVVLAVLLHSIAVPTARADVEVVQIDGSGSLTSIVVSETSPGSGVWDVAFTAEGTPTIRVAVQADEEDVIRTINVNSTSVGGAGRKVELVTRTKPTTSGRIVRIENIRIISNSPGADGELVLFDVETQKTSGGSDGNIGSAGTTQSGEIEAHHVVKMLAAGHITGNVRVFNTIGGTRGIIEITAGDDLLSEHLQTDGRIGRIEADKIGSVNALYAVHIHSEVEIGNIDTGDLFRAYVLADADGTPKPIRRIECGSLGLEGSIECSTFTDDVGGTGNAGLIMSGAIGGGTSVVVHGDLDAPIQTPGLSGLIWLAGDLPTLAAATLSIGTGNLSGQVIVNGADAGGEWLGLVGVGNIVLSPTVSPPDQAPWYARTAQALGFGAVGVAPFQLHYENCKPAATPVSGTLRQGCANVGSGGPPNNEVVLWSSGPWTWDDTGFMPVTIEWSTPISQNCPPSNTSWADVTSDFTVSPGGDRALILSPVDPTVHFAPGTVYRIRPVRSGVPEAILRCKDVTGSPPVGEWTYYLVVGTGS